MTSPRAALLETLRVFVLPIAVGAAGGFAFWIAGLPAAWMSGSLIAAAVAGLCGLTIRTPDLARTACFLLMGTVMGSAVTPETLRLMTNWPVSMAGLLILSPAIVAAIMVYLVRFERWDKTSAFYGAVPGAMTYVMALALSSKADARSVVIVQSFRIMVLVVAMPSLLVAAGLGGARSASPLSTAAVEWYEFPVLIGVSFAAGWAAERLGMPGGLTVGAMAASAVLHATGWTAARIPEPFLVLGFVVIGVLIAERFSGLSPREFRALLRPAAGAFVVGTAVSVLIAALVALLTGLPVGKLILAYAPGGIEAMAVLAFVLDMDPAFVGAHHVVRFTMIAVLLPFAARLALGRCN